jgi:predicted dehydrogenase
LKEKIFDESVNLVWDINAVSLGNFDLVIMANPSSDRINIFSRLSEKNKKFVFEKPVAQSLEEAYKIKKIIEEKGCEVIVNYQLRHDSNLRRLKEIISSEEFGRLLYAEIDVGQYLPEWRTNIDYRDSVSARSKLGGGVLLELSHEIDYALWLFGVPQLIQSFIGRLSSLEIDVEDFAKINLIYSNNKFVTITLDFFRSDRSRKCTLRFENATVFWDALKSELILEKNGTHTKNLLNTESCDVHELQWDDIVDFVNNQGSNSADFASSLEVLNVIEIVRNGQLSSAVNPVSKIQDDDN